MARWTQPRAQLLADSYYRRKKFGMPSTIFRAHQAETSLPTNQRRGCATCMRWRPDRVRAEGGDATRVAESAGRLARDHD